MVEQLVHPQRISECELAFKKLHANKQLSPWLPHQGKNHSSRDESVDILTILATPVDLPARTKT